MSEADLYPAGMRVKDIFKWTGSFYGCFDLEKAHKLAEAYEPVSYTHLDVYKRQIYIR